MADTHAIVSAQLEAEQQGQKQQTLIQQGRMAQAYLKELREKFPVTMQYADNPDCENAMVKIEGNQVRVAVKVDENFSYLINITTKYLFYWIEDGDFEEKKQRHFGSWTESETLAFLESERQEILEVLQERRQYAAKKEAQRQIKGQWEESHRSKLNAMIAALEDMSHAYTQMADTETKKTLWQWPEGKSLEIYQYKICIGTLQGEADDDVDFDYETAFSFVAPQDIPNGKGFIEVLDYPQFTYKIWVDISKPILLKKYEFGATEELLSPLKRKFPKNSVVTGVKVFMPTTEYEREKVHGEWLNRPCIATSEYNWTIVLPEDAQILRERFGDDIKIGDVLEPGALELRRRETWAVEPIDQIKEALS